MKLVLVHCEEKENRLAKGTELLFGECGMIPESMEITVEFHDRPEIRVDKKENHLHISCREGHCSILRKKATVIRKRCFLKGTV